MVEMFANSGGEELTLTGGEPLLDPATSELLLLAKARQLRTVVFTSGALPAADGIMPLPERLLADLSASIDRLVVNLYSTQSSAHDAITGVEGSQAVAIESTRRALAAGIATEFHFVPMRGSVDEVRNVYALALAMGVSAVRVIRFVEHGRASLHPELRPTSQELPILKAALTDLQQDGRIRLQVGSAFRFLIDFAPHCSAGIEEVVVGWDGTIIPCSGFKGFSGPEAVGNALDTPLMDLWERSPFLQAMRGLIGARIESRDAVVGCPAQQAAVAGSITDEVPDPDL